MKTNTAIILVALLVLLYFFLNATYIGVTTQPSEGDSLAYHIPIAQSILNGSVTNPYHIANSLGFYPGSGEIVLAIFMLLHIPLNLYNVVGWVVLGYFLIRLGKAYALGYDASLLFAFSAMTPLAMVRLLTSQTIDIWLAVFFTASLLFLKRPEKTFRYFVCLGVSLGLLIGSKFSGPFYASVLLLIWWKPLWNVINLTRVFMLIIPVFLLGLSWYMRNAVLTGNPLYPQSFGPLSGDTHFTLMDWVGWKTLFYTRDGLFMTLWSLFSEYMFWCMIPFLAGILLLQSYRTSRKELSAIVPLLWLTVINFLIYFFLPSVPENIITYLRYLFPAFIPGILAIFVYYGKSLEKWYPLILMNTIVLFSLTDHQPKLILVYLILAGILILKYDILQKYLVKV